MHTGADADSPPQASRKRKAHPAIHSTTGGTSKHPAAEARHPTQLSRHNRLKSIGKRHKQPAIAPPPSSPAVPRASPGYTQQQISNSIDGAEHVAGCPPLPVGMLDAQASGVPSSHLVQHTMHQLSHTLSSEPLGTAQVAASKETLKAHSDCTGPSGVLAASDQNHVGGEVKRHVDWQGCSAGAAPVLQPFLAPPANPEAKEEDNCKSGYGPDSAEHQQQAALASATEAENMQGRHASYENQGLPSCSQPPVPTGVAAEGQLDRQAGRESDAEGQTQEERAPSPPEKGQEALPKAQTGNALQQLITRAQKLKEQLDAHAERKANRWDINALCAHFSTFFFATVTSMPFIIHDQQRLIAATVQN